MLRPARVRRIREVGRKVRIGQGPGERGHIPKQKWHQDKCECEDEDGDEPFLGDRQFGRGPKGIVGMWHGNHTISLYITNNDGTPAPNCNTPDKIDPCTFATSGYVPP